MNPSEAPALVVKPGEGRSVSLGGMGVVFKISGANTGGAFAIVEHPIDAGGSCSLTSTDMRTSIPMFWRGPSVRGSATGRSSRDQEAT
jgi:hypothetical protein